MPGILGDGCCWHWLLLNWLFTSLQKYEGHLKAPTHRGSQNISLRGKQGQPWLSTARQDPARDDEEEEEQDKEVKEEEEEKEDNKEGQGDKEAVKEVVHNETRRCSLAELLLCELFLLSYCDSETV